jgi:hypothetical protein
MMLRHLVALAALGLVFAAIACGGGSSGSVTYAPTVVTINHMDFSGTDLTYKELRAPPFVDEYPVVVATVNGVSITGLQLAREQVQLELARRNWQNSLPDVFPKAVIDREVQGIEAADPLEAAIDKELEKQAADRLGLAPSHQEALRLTRQAEDASNKALASAAPDQKPMLEEMLRVQGLLNTDWTASPKVVEGYRLSSGIHELQTRYCKLKATPSLLSVSTSRDCAAFLARERKNAKIVYYVRWAD